MLNRLRARFLCTKMNHVTSRRFYCKGVAAVLEQMAQQLFKKVGHQILKKLGQQMLTKIDRQLFHTIETDGRLAGANEQMFLTYTIAFCPAWVILLCFNPPLYHYSPVYCYITYKTTISEKISLRVATPSVSSSYFHTHPLTLLLQILGGWMHGPSPL